MSAPSATGPSRITPPGEEGRSPERPRPAWTEEAPGRLVAWLEADARPRLLVTLQGQVIWMSAAAAALPRRSFPFAADDANQRTEERRLDPRLLAELGPVAGQ